MGMLTERDDGTQVGREFDAPKTQVMGIIINGVMGGNLNWSMVALGALIAIMLELCGVSALAFAVGVYVPIQYSVPIFLGGICRWAIDEYLARQAAAEAGDVANDPEAQARAEIEAIKKSETSPGVLLASGYIAGGSIAGVVVAFLEFAPDFKKALDLDLLPAKLPPNLDYAYDVIAVLGFAVLVGFAAIVGMGKVFKAPEEESASPSRVD